MNQTRNKSNTKWRRTLLFAISAGFAVCVILVAWNLFGDNGILANMRLEKQHASLVAEKDRLQRENARLIAEIRDLQTSSRKIEEVAREELGLGRPGEIIFVFPENEKEPVRQYRNKQE